MATIAAILHGVGRCAILLERALLKFAANWMRHQVARLDNSMSPAPQQQRKN